MNDECNHQYQKKFTYVCRETFRIEYNLTNKFICGKNKKKSAHIALSVKNAPTQRQMPKNAAHKEKPKKCRIFVRRTIAFCPRVYPLNSFAENLYCNIYFLG